MEFSSLAASFLGGGLAGGCISIFYNQRSRQRDLRTRFYPKLNDMYSAYMIRMEKSEGRYWKTIVGNNPSSADEEFVNHRSRFVSDLIQFNELKEARVLRRQMLENLMRGNHAPGQPTTIDLAPELKALGDCLNEVHKKLRL